VRAVNQEGTSALMFAVVAERPELVGLLLRSGANPQGEDNNGWTPRDYAEEIEDEEVRRQVLALLAASGRQSSERNR
jgi:FOG: Ankyrin repeat